jgi:hypothetical protein
MNRYFLLIAFSLLITTVTYANNQVQEHEMLIKVVGSRDAIESLQDAGLYIYDIENGYIRGAILPGNIQKIKQMGYKYEVLIPDMVKYSELVAPGSDLGRYHSYQEIMDTFNLIANTYPNICHLDTIGQSPTGKYLLALKISENAQQEMHRPRMLWDGTTHGNENIGTEVCWYIVQQLITRYNFDPVIAHIVNTREIWIIPCMNPEGLINRTRGNTICQDLNRDYGYAWRTSSGSGMSTPWSQPETRGFHNFLQQRPFVLHMTYHSGATSVMWPWSYSTMATLDSISHAELCNRYHNITGLSAYQISRGLYVCYGTATDYSYGEEGALGLAAEISSGQPPAATQIDTINHANWTASLDLMTRCAYGIRGLITDSITGLPIQKAIVVADPPNWMTYTDTCGWYYKYIQPGIHTLKIIADGYQTKIISGITIPTDSYVIVDAVLQPDTILRVTGYKIVTWICQTTLAGGTMASWTLGPRDSRVLKLSSRSSVTIELSRPILDSAGIDFTVYSPTLKPCSVFVSDDAWTGPWHFCTYGTGNVGCNITNAGVSSARYVKVADAGQNYELDAIESGSVVSGISDLPIYELQNPVLVIKPNPFRHTTQIQWQLAGNNITDIKIYNTTGSLVKTFNRQVFKSPILWDGTDNLGKKLPKGIYFIRLENDNLRLVNKIILTD